MNECLLVGKLIKDIETVDDKIIVTIQTTRHYKNANGKYDVDVLKVNLLERTEEIKKFIKKGDVIAIKGSITSDKSGNIELIASKVSFWINKTKI